MRIYKLCTLVHRAIVKRKVTKRNNPIACSLKAKIRNVAKPGRTTIVKTEVFIINSKNLKELQNYILK